MIGQASQRVLERSTTKGAERQRLLKRRRKVAGLCIRCGAVPPVGQCTQCAKCLAKLSFKARERAAKRKSLGQCVRCAKPSAEGITHCRICTPLSERTIARRLAAQERRRAVAETNSRARELVREHLGFLTPRQREVMVLRMGLNGDKARSGPDIGKLLGVSKQAVSTVEASAWKRIECVQALPQDRVGTG